MESEHHAAPAPYMQGKQPVLPSAFSLFQPSIDALKINLGTILLLVFTPLLMAIPWIAITLVNAANASNFNSNAVLGLLTFLFTIGMIVVGVILSPAIVIAQLKGSKGERITYGEAFNRGAHVALRFLGLSLLTGLITMAGFILLIVPGLFLMKRYLMAPCYLVDKKVGILEAMRLSARDSKEFSGALWGIIGVSFLIALPCVIPILGYIAAVVLSIMYACATTIRYYQIQYVREHPGHSAPVEQ